MDCDNDDLNRLLSRVASGHRQAFAALYRQTAPKLLGITRRILRNHELAEDVLQDVYTKIWRDAAKFDPARGNAMAWMTIMARNQAIDTLRKRRRSPVTAVEFPENVPTSQPITTVTGPDAVDRIALLRCLALLEPERRNMVLEAYFEGRSREELAQRFGRPVGTVKTWLRASLATLRECLLDPEELDEK